MQHLCLHVITYKLAMFAASMAALMQNILAANWRLQLSTIVPDARKADASAVHTSVVPYLACRGSDLIILLDTDQQRHVRASSLHAAERSVTACITGTRQLVKAAIS